MGEPAPPRSPLVSWGVRPERQAVCAVMRWCLGFTVYEVLEAKLGLQGQLLAAPVSPSSHLLPLGLSFLICKMG